MKTKFEIEKQTARMMYAMIGWGGLGALAGFAFALHMTGC